MKDHWDDNNVWIQALILAYNQVREYDEAEETKALTGSGSSSKIPRVPKVRGRSRGRHR